ncbi:hypothetical protein PT974_03391 [Cladobotryum mycophilum]|uniref:Uncharacterized protein n=1 Tax=Cladobotryum mycophilum TaxID=491253 RepID=A0ABR0STC9_9HYPO
MPIFMLASATENMAQVEEVADKIDEEKKKAFIIAFLSAVFLIVPFVGEVVGSIAGLAELGIVLGVLGAAGDATLDIYTIVDDPENAPMAIFDLVLAPLALLDIAKIAKASSLRRGMRAEDVAKLSKGVKRRMDIIDKVKGICRRDL